jgi:RNA polymerase sigma-70 factor (ECF subfamily)
MEQTKEIIIEKIEESLNRIAASCGVEVSNEIKPILLNNLAHHRVETYIENDLDQVEAYVELVAEKYSHWHNYINAIQNQRDPLAWEQLLPQLIEFAHAFFIRKGFDSSSNTDDYAQECAGNAATSLLKAQFPYDTDFEPWAHRIVQLNCLRYMRENMRKREIPAENLVELSEEFESADEEADVLKPLIDAELQEVIAAAIKHLSKARQDIIHWRYFDQLSFNEIAERMGKSLDAVYGLQFNALRELRKILLKTGIDFNEE